MSTKLLVRDMPKHGSDDPIDELTDTLLVSAKRVLGYQAPEDSADAKWIAEQEAVLAKALKKLDIRPFTQASVAAYKESAAADERDKGKLWQAKWFMRAQNTFIISGPATLATAFVAGLAVLCGMPAEIMYATLVPGLATLVAAAICIGCVDTFNVWNNREFLWNSQKIEDVRGLRIPEFALQTAVELKEVCPEATIYVDQLQEFHRPTPDPFIYAVIERPAVRKAMKITSPWGNEPTHFEQIVSPGIATRRYYLEVWNEPKYKQEREV